MGLSSAGIGSNLDVNGIVSQLMAVEQKPLTLLSKREASYQAKLSAIGSIKGALSSFQSTVKGLSDISKFQALRVSAADTTVASATADTNAVPGTYALEVTKLAQAQKLAAAGQTSASTTIDNGTLTFDFGTITGGTLDASGKYTNASFATNGSGIKTVTIDATNNTLSGIRDAINSAKIGVTATIVNDGSSSPYRLVLTDSSTGKSNSMKISVSGDTGALSTLLSHDPALPPAGQALSETATAQNAEFKLDGLSVSKAGNTITDVIPGVTFNLLKTNVATPTNITVVRDTTSIVSAVGQFVSAFNQINQTLKDVSSYNASTKQAGPLNGDATVRNLQSQIRSVLGTPIAGGAGAFTQLSEIGVTVQKDGTLAVDNVKLQSKIDTNFNDIAGLFAAVGKPTDSLVAFSGSTTKTASGAYALNVTQLATQGKTVGDGGTPASLTIDGTNNTLEVLLDGISATVTLTSDTYATAAALAAEIQSKINGVASFVAAGSAVAVTASGVLTITSNRYGSASAASITGGTGKANLVGAPIPTAGLDVAATINGVAGTGSGQVLTGPTADATEGLSLTITGGILGPRGTVNYSQGYAYQFDKLATLLLGTDGPLSSRTEGLNASLKSLAAEKLRINDRLTATEKRYRAQFNALDTVISKMKTTSEFLTQQLQQLSNLSNG